MRHGERSSPREGVVVQVHDPKLRVLAHGCSQRRHACVVYSVLGQVDFLQAANQLK